MKAGIVSPRIRRKTKKRLAKEKLEKEKKLVGKTEEEIEVIINHEVALEDSHPRGEKPKYFGELTEMDGSSHLWFGEKKSCLHLAADKTTNTIVGAYFDWQETLNGYYNVFHQILVNYGIPYNKDKRTSDKDVLTQFGYACKQLGTDLETTSVSQAKGLIERDNGTFQGRLINELKLNNITTIEEANEYAYSHGLIPFSVSSPNFGLAEQVADPWGGGCVSISGSQNQEARDWYRRMKMPIVAYSSLARGLFSGRVRGDAPEDADKILDMFAMKGYASPRNFERLRRCERLAAEKKTTVAQIALC